MTKPVAKPAALLRMGSADTAWMEQGACHGMWDTFDLAYRDGLGHVDNERRHTPAEAHAVGVCKTRCPVREQCLGWAFEVNETRGVLGGMTEWERKEFRRRTR
jgi:hypothetical protein